MTAVYRSPQLREIEQAALKRGEPLMERAGLAIAEFARTRCRPDEAILIVVGPGNNGGDALVAARRLRQWGYRPHVLAWFDPERLPQDAANAWQGWLQIGGDKLETIPPGEPWRLVIDGLFGLGLNRPLSALWHQRIDSINAIAAPKLAIDLPSGLDADTGRRWGNAVVADWTLTLLGLKPGLYTGDGVDCVGRVTLDRLGQPAPPASAITLCADWPASLALLARPRNAHKGLFGSVGVIGGSEGMLGAALLAGRAALKMGTGRVTVGLLGQGCTVDPLQPELMLQPYSQLEHCAHLSTLAIGPGLGCDAAANAALHSAIARPLPLVLDADALNLLAANPQLASNIRARLAPTVLTPHPAEAARLLNITTAAVQADRVAACQQLCQHWNAVVVLKGAGSLVGDGQRCSINHTGNAGLSSAGQGDVLTGMLAALLAQGLAAFDAAQLAVYLHGSAGDRAVANGRGPVGLTASEVIDEARHLLNHALLLQQPQRYVTAAASR